MFAIIVPVAGFAATAARVRLLVILSEAKNLPRLSGNELRILRRPAERDSSE
jgi:hypothetical protein